MKYPFRVNRATVGNHIFWVAEIPTLHGCVAQGETLEQALAQLEINEREWLDAAKEFDLEIPEIPVEEMELYSGKFTVRMAAHVHKTATELAKKQGVSLNQYVNEAIVAQNASLISSAALLPCVERAMEQIKWMTASAITESKAVSKNSLVAKFDDEEETMHVLFKTALAK